MGVRPLSGLLAVAFKSNLSGRPYIVFRAGACVGFVYFLALRIHYELTMQLGCALVCLFPIRAQKRICWLCAVLSEHSLALRVFNVTLCGLWGAVCALLYTH